MAASSKSAFVVAVALAAAWIQAGGCSAGDDERSGSSGSRDGGTTDVSVLDAPPPDQGSGGIEGLDPLCGQAVCLPDSPVAAPGDAGLLVVPPSSGGAGGEGGGGGQAGEGPGGQGGESGAPGGAGGEGGRAGEGGVGGELTGGEGGGAAGTMSVPPPVRACRVMRDGNRVISDWAPAGGQGVNGPCFSSEDCRPGLGCVNHDDVGGRCLPFCCAGNDSCTAPGTYCAPRRLLEKPLNAPNGGASGLLVPVCVVAVACNLEQPYPCPSGQECSCGDEACMVVRSGLTSCEVPGEGEAGDPCPCAWGHVCSQTTNTCVELCTTATDAKACSTGKCQDTAELPPDWGVCVGAATSR